MRITQLLVGARAGDAVTEIALRNRTVLREVASSEVVARFVDASAASEVVGLAQWEPLDADDLLILHVTIGDAEVLEAVRATEARVVLMFHNITPPTYFDEVDAAFADLLRGGEAMLRSLVDRAERVVVASSFNHDDVVAAGFTEVDRLPYLVDPMGRSNLVDLDFAASLRDNTSGPLVISVGQILPHKRPDLLVGALHLLTAFHEPDATLLLVGPHPLSGFARAVERLIRSFGLEGRVRMTGPLTDAQLAECYRAADVFVSASSHEGFCVPVLEAMAFDVPVVAVDRAALPETVGGAGLVVDQRADVLCEAIALALEQRTASEMVRAGRRRLAEFDLGTSAEALGAWVAALVAN